MKSYFIILIFSFVYVHGLTMHHHHRRELEEVTDACMDEIDIPKSTIRDALISRKFTRNEKIDCLTHCILRKLKFQLEDGTFMSEVAHNRALETNVDIELYDKVLDQCKNLVGKNRCETAGNIFECFMKYKSFPFYE